MGTEVIQVLQGRLRTNDGPTVFLKMETEGGKTRCAGSLLQYFTTRTEKTPSTDRKGTDTDRNGTGCYQDATNASGHLDKIYISH